MWRKRNRSMVAGILLVLGGALRLHGHGDVHESIVAITKEIDGGRASAALFMQRASLYSENGHFTEALADIDAAEKLTPGNDALLALRSGVLRLAGKLTEARAGQEAYLQRHPENAQVRFDYSRTLAELKDADGAIRELDTLIAAAEHPAPDAVAMRLKLTENRGLNGPAEALAWISEFVSRHPLPVFEEEALRLEIQLRRNAEAMRRLDAMISRAPRPESLLLRKADLLSAAGDAAAAREAARAAADAIARLPAHIRGNRATAALDEKARRFLSSTPP